MDGGRVMGTAGYVGPASAHHIVYIEYIEYKEEKE